MTINAKITYSSLNAWIVGYECKTFNLFLREKFVEPRNKGDEDWIQEEVQALINAALTPLATPITVYRGTCEKFVSGESFEDKGLMSFSKDFEVAQKFAFQRAKQNNSQPVIIKTVAKYGLDVDVFYETNYEDFDHNSQREVIIAPSKFVITRITIKNQIKVLSCEAHKLALNNEN